MILLLEASEPQKNERPASERSRTTMMAFAVLLIALAAILVLLLLSA